jgi:hypothetical protein
MTGRGLYAKHVTETHAASGNDPDAHFFQKGQRFLHLSAAELPFTTTSLLWSN